MKTEESKAVLKRRGAIVEAVFGRIKTVGGAPPVHATGQGGLCVGIETPLHHAQPAETLPGPDQGQTRGRPVPGFSILFGLKGDLPPERAFSQRSTGEIEGGSNRIPIKAVLLPRAFSKIFG
jgi:hypothetical protein